MSTAYWLVIGLGIIVIFLIINYIMNRRSEKKEFFYSGDSLSNKLNNFKRKCCNMLKGGL